MATNGATKGHVLAALPKALEGLPTPPDILSDEIKALLGRALTEPTTLTSNEIQKLAASVLFHLVKLHGEKAAES